MDSDELRRCTDRSPVSERICTFGDPSCYYGVAPYLTNSGDDIVYWFCQCMYPAEQWHEPPRKLLSAAPLHSPPDTCDSTHAIGTLVAYAKRRGVPLHVAVTCAFASEPVAVKAGRKGDVLRAIAHLVAQGIVCYEDGQCRLVPDTQEPQETRSRPE